MKQLLAMAVPILPGKTNQWKKFSDELNGSRHREFAESRKRLNVHERVFLQSTPHGDFAVVTLEGPNPEEAFKKFSEGNDEFTKWFNSQVKELHGMDLRNPPPGVLPTMVINSMEEVMQH
jgi:hypothetical protein